VPVPGTADRVASGGPVRVAVVGTGWWGTEHARAYAVSPDADLVAIAGRNGGVTRRRAAQFGVPPFEDLDAMLDAAAPDLVSVAVAPQSQHAVVSHLLSRGQPVFAEKPLGVTVAQARDLVDAADRAGVFFGVDFNHRYARPVRLARAALADGRLGTLSLAVWQLSGEYTRGLEHGNLLETQCHGFDLIEHLCGPVESVSAELSDAGTPGRPDTVAVTLRLVGGALGCLLSTAATSYAHALTLYGTGGRVEVADTVRRFAFTATGSEHTEVWEAGYFNDPDRSLLSTLDGHVADVLAAVRAGAPPPVPGAAGLRALELGWAAVEAARTGGRVDVRPAGSAVQPGGQLVHPGT
jgi:myo-inositol 2-dehydrogenase/D-chiro-inositol 1-dehydrogenase